MNVTAEQWQAVGLSLRVAVTAVLISLPFGVALAWLLARRQFRGKAILETLINLPLVLPPVVTGLFAAGTLWGETGWIGRFLDHWLGLQIVFTWKAAVLASAIMAFPLMVRAMRVALASVDVHLEQAARERSAPDRGTRCGRSRCRWLGMGSSPVACWRLPAASANSARRSWCRRTRRARARFRWRSTTCWSRPGGVERAQGLVLASIAIAAVAMFIGEILRAARAAAHRRVIRMARLRFTADTSFSRASSSRSNFEADGRNHWFVRPFRRAARRRRWRSSPARCGRSMGVVRLGDRRAVQHRSRNRAAA